MGTTRTWMGSTAVRDEGPQEKKKVGGEFRGKSCGGVSKSWGGSRGVLSPRIGGADSLGLRSARKGEIWFLKKKGALKKKEKSGSEPRGYGQLKSLVGVP